MSDINVGVFAVQSLPPPLTVTPNRDQNLEFNSRKPGTTNTMTYVNDLVNLVEKMTKKP